MNFVVPESIEEAVAVLAAARGTTHILAGGTDLIVQMRAGRRQVDTLIDIKRIPRLNAITSTAGGGWRIGAAVCAAALREHAALRADWPGFVEAVNLIGSMQVQSRATAIGNLCNASPGADSVPGAIAAAATVTVLGPRGERVLAVEDLPVGPGRTALAADEFIAFLDLPARGPRGGDAYLRLTPRAEMDIAVVGAGVSLALDAHGRIARARVALGAVAPTALLVPAAGAALVGSRLDAAALARLEAAVSAACSPIDDKRGTAAYRRKGAPVLARRAALIALERANARKE